MCRHGQIIEIGKELNKTPKVDDVYSLNLPSETEGFIFRITATKIIMEHPQLYSYHLEEGGKRASIDALFLIFQSCIFSF